MLGLAKEVLIFAAENGLVLYQPRGKNPPDPEIKITYRTHNISVVPQADFGGDAVSLETYGLVGILDVVSTAYLIAITQRQQVAQVRGHAVYAIRDVKLIPLTSQSEAAESIGDAVKRLKQDRSSNAAAEIEESGGEEVDEEDDSLTNEGHDELTGDAAAEKGTTTSVDQDAAQGKGKSRSFASRWFGNGGSKSNAQNKKGSSEEKNLTADSNDHAIDSKSNNEKKADPDTEPPTDPKTTDTGAGPDQTADESTEKSKSKSAIEYLAPRIKRSARLYFSSSGFFFSYEHDLSGTLLQKGTSVSYMPLWKRFDPLYFWNHNLIKPLIDSGCDEFVLPLMQGFVGQRAFSITKAEETENHTVAGALQNPADVVGATPTTTSDTQDSDENARSQDFLLTLVSRRSVERAGLRYLRRGVDDDGNVANSVETEQILSTRSWDVADKAYSLIQYRGSIPLHFTQTPPRLKPAPIIFGSDATNQAALKKHFAILERRYRQIEAVALIDKQGVESSIGEAYESHVKRLNEGSGIDGKQIGFEWFDFHSTCKGMNFQNVSILLDSLEIKLKSFGWNTKQHDRNFGQQGGVVRTNCMDCLDRTNVVQSYIGGWALQQQLVELGLNVDLKTDATTQWFNTLWADNGDALSRQYAGSAALKGDFTRTRKRNWIGALSDFSLTLTRYYNNMFADYFLQTCIEYFLGNAKSTIFDEFQSDMMSKDYALDMRRIRQNAIETCVTIVLEDPQDHLMAGWTLSCPRKANTLRTLPFEECVVLLTKEALYCCRFDWSTEKVNSFEKVDLAEILDLWRGVYITNALGQTNLDETKNVGFAVKYKASDNSMTRNNTQQLRSGDEGSDEEDETESKKKQEGTKKQNDTKEDEPKLLAFKALPPQSSAVKYEDEKKMANATEMDLIRHICGEVQRAIEARVSRNGSKPTEGVPIPEVEEQDIISVADAKKNTGYMESIGYSLKRLVWS